MHPPPLYPRIRRFERIIRRWAGRGPLRPSTIVAYLLAFDMIDGVYTRGSLSFFSQFFRNKEKALANISSLPQCLSDSMLWSFHIYRLFHIFRYVYFLEQHESNTWSTRLAARIQQRTTHVMTSVSSWAAMRESIPDLIREVPGNIRHKLLHFHFSSRPMRKNGTHYSCSTTKNKDRLPLLPYLIRFICL